MQQVRRRHGRIYLFFPMYNYDKRSKSGRRHTLPNRYNLRIYALHTLVRTL